MFDKKGQGLPLNTIIIAIIVIVTLVVIILIFVSQSQQQQQAYACEARGGECEDSGCTNGRTPLPGISCETDGDTCCIDYGLTT